MATHSSILAWRIPWTEEPGRLQPMGTHSRTFTTMLNNSDESGHPCLVPDLRGNAFSFSPLRIVFVIGLSYMVFTMLWKVTSMSSF